MAIFALLPTACLTFSLITPQHAKFEALAASRAPIARPASTTSHLRMLDDEAKGSAPASPAYIEFIVGYPEPCVPDVQLTRSRDGSTGVATFTFDNPSFLTAASESLGETTGAFRVSGPLCDASVYIHLGILGNAWFP